MGEKTPTTKKCPKKKHNEQNSNETKHINIKRPQNEENERKQSKMHILLHILKMHILFICYSWDKATAGSFSIYLFIYFLNLSFLTLPQKGISVSSQTLLG